MMKVLTSVLTIVALPLLVLAHGDDYIQARRHYARQASSSASSHLGPTTELSTSDANPSNPVNRLVAASTMSPNSFSVSLFSTNPTAVPLASIVSNEPSMPTQALTTEAPGVTPSYMPNAPPLPNSTFHTLCPSFFRSPPLRTASISQLFSIVANWNATAYPPLDLVPSTDSQEVLQWIRDVKNTGIQIPSLQVTNPGSCRTIFLD